jgi:NDP-sugar pyrophosphorylase family protein
MKAVILAGGFGTRLQSVVSDLPKPMAPIGGKPFLEYLLLQLLRWGIRDIVLSVGYLGKMIEAYFGDGDKWRASIGYCREESPLGTGGAIREAARMTGNGDILVMNGDSFLDLDFHEFMRVHDARGKSVTMALAPRDNCGRYGRVELGPDGTVLAFAEKMGDGSGLINGGIYICRRTFPEGIPPGVVSFEKDVLPALVPGGIAGMVAGGFFIDIGVPEDYRFVRDHPGMLSPGDESAR